ncbi:hypothetical protein [Vulcanisaeta souniana]|nr:hypothetical protein [Vulcanisaeta souniana]
MIKFYMVVGKDETYENVIRNVVSEVREKFKGSEKNVNATFIRIKPEAVDAAINALSMPEGQIPQNLIYLVKSMRQDGIRALPALIINGKKIYEGQLPPPDTVKQTVMDEVIAVLSPQAPMQPPTMQPVQPIMPQPSIRATQTQQAPPPSSPPPPPPSPPPPPPTQVETKQPTEEMETRQPTQQEGMTTISERLQVQTVQLQPLASQTKVKLVMGRPNDCRECIYFGSNTGVCLLFGYKIIDPARPPCKS